MKRNYDTYIDKEGWLIKSYHTVYMDQGKVIPVTLECKSGDSPLLNAGLMSRFYRDRIRYDTPYLDENGVLFRVYHRIFINKRGKPLLVNIKVNSPSEKALERYVAVLFDIFKEYERCEDKEGYFH